MTTLRPFTCTDLLKFNEINLDPLTETLHYERQVLHYRKTCDTALLISYGWKPFDHSQCSKVIRVMRYHGSFLYAMSFYMQYLAHWPEYFQIAVAPNGDLMGYIMGKAEGSGENWHGHVTALTVSPKYRRLGVAATLMKSLEDISERKNCYFVDLFVRKSNKNAIAMYEKLGYTIYRIVLEYYSGDPDEDAYDMRKALSRDVEKKSIIPQEHSVRPEDVDG